MKFFVTILCLFAVCCDSKPPPTAGSVTPRPFYTGMDSDLQEIYCIYTIFPPRSRSKTMLLQNGSITSPQVYAVTDNAFKTVGPEFEPSKDDIETFCAFIEDPNSFGSPIAAVFDLSFVIVFKEPERVALFPPGIYLIAVSTDGQMVPFRNGLCLTRSPISTSDEFGLFLKTLKSKYVK